MPRVHLVKKARASTKSRRCTTCDTEIQAGDPYKYAEPYTGPMKFWCKDHSPKRSQLSNSKMGPLWDAVDDFDPSGSKDIEDIKSDVQAIAEVAREVAQDYQDGIDNMPEGLQEGPTAQESQEKVEILESYADTLESWEPSDTGDEETEEDLQDQAEEEVRRDMLHEWSDNLGDLAEDIAEGSFDPEGDDQDQYVFNNYVDQEEYETRVREWLEDHKENPPEGLVEGWVEEATSTVQELEL